MRNLKTIPSRLLVTTLCLLITCAAHAAKPPPLSSADCDAALTVSATQMDFGTYIEGSSGQIIVNLDGTLTILGPLTPGPQTGAAAAFLLGTTLAQCQQKDVTFTMPPIFSMTNSVTTTNVYDTINDLPGPTFVVGRGITIKMGGTITVTPGDTPGTYFGNINELFSYVLF